MRSSRGSAIASALASLSGLALAAACGPSSPSAKSLPPDPPAPPPSALQPTASPEPSESASAPPPASAPPAKPPPVVAAPPNIPPPHARTAKAGDGKWTPVDASPERPFEGWYQTVIHPHPRRRYQKVTLVAVDLAFGRLSLHAGTKEPPSSVLTEAERPGKVPSAEWASLRGVFNGGFKVRHGKYGMRIANKTLLAPRKDACVVILSQTGDGLTIGPWSELQDAAEKSFAYRQTPHCLLHKGKLHKDLSNDYRSRHWGAALGGKKTIRRSGLAISPDGRYVYYGVGEELRALDLARGLAATGAKEAVELDINWSYTRFLFYGGGPEAPEIIKTLIPKMKHSRRGYVKSASGRDFFSIHRKPKASWPAR